MTIGPPTPRPHWNPLTTESPIDPKELDLLLSEVILLNTRTEVYWRFLHVRLENDVDSLSENEAVEFLDTLKADLIEKSELCRTMQEVMGHYVLMEEYFMRISVAKAEALDSIDEDMSQTTSSMVRRPVKARKSARAEKKCQRSWLS